MKKAISYSSDFMRSIDLDNATFEQQGLQMLENFNPDNDMTLTTSQSKHIEAPAMEPGKVNTDYYNNLLS